MRRKKNITGDDDAAPKRAGRKNRRVNLEVRVAAPARHSTRLPTTGHVGQGQSAGDAGGPKRTALEVLEDGGELVARTAAEEAMMPAAGADAAGRPDFVDRDREKRMLMWVGVTFFMALVLILWIFNLKNMFAEQKRNVAARDTLDLVEIESSFDKAIQDVNASLSRFNELASTTTAATSTGNFIVSNATTSQGAVGSGTAAQTGNQEIIDLKNKLEELERRLYGTSTKSTNN